MIPFATGIAAVLLVIGCRLLHKGGKTWMKWVATVGVFICGAVLTQTTFGSWIAAIGPVFGVINAAVFVTILILLVRDLMDRRPDKAAFWCAFGLPISAMIGVAHVQALANMAANGTGDFLARLASIGG